MSSNRETPVLCVKVLVLLLFIATVELATEIMLPYTGTSSHAGFNGNSY